MCGIVGIYNKYSINKYSKESLEKAVSCLRHRGPDDTGAVYRANYASAQTRLSIIDLSWGKQPVHNEDKTFWVSSNGEIFNCVELIEFLRKKGNLFYTESDTETIVHIYEEYKEKVFDHLNGHFAIAICDSNIKKLVLGRDRSDIFENRRRIEYETLDKNVITVPSS